MKVLQNELFPMTSYRDLKDKLVQKLASAGFVVTTLDANTSQVQLPGKQAYAIRWMGETTMLALGINGVYHGSVNYGLPGTNIMCLLVSFDDGTFVFTQPPSYMQINLSFAFYINTECIGKDGIYPAVHLRGTNSSNRLDNYMVISYAQDDTKWYAANGNSSDTGLSMPVSTIHPVTKLPVFYKPLFYYDSKFVGAAENYLVCANTKIFTPFQIVYIGGKKYMAIYSPTGHLTQVFFAQIEDD